MDGEQVQAHCYLVVKAEKDYHGNITGAKVQRMNINPPTNVGGDETVINLKLNIPVARFIPPVVPAQVQAPAEEPEAEEESEDG